MITVLQVKNSRLGENRCFNGRLVLQKGKDWKWHCFILMNAGVDQLPLVPRDGDKLNNRSLYTACKEGFVI